MANVSPPGIGVSSVVGSALFLGDATWASLPSAATYNGWYVWITNAGAGGSLWRSNGTRWKPVNGTATLATLDTTSANIPNSEAVVFQYQLPAGLWQVPDKLRLYLTFTKSGTTDSLTYRVRIGTAGTTADTQVQGGTIIGAAGTEASVIHDIRLQSATSAMVLPNNVASFGYNGVAGVAGSPSPTAISSATTNALYVNATIVSTGASNTVNLVSGQLDLIASAN